jgi:HEAT repeat protein
MSDNELIKDLLSDDACLRMQTIISLKNLGAGKAAEILIPVFSEDDQDLRNTIMSTLLEIGKPAIPYLINALKSNNSAVRNNAAKILAEVGDSSISIEILNLLKESDAPTRATALDILGNMKDFWSVEYLREFLTDPDFRVRVAAARALGNLKDKLSVDSLISLLSDDDDMVKIAAAEALGKINNPRACDGLWQLNINSKNPEVRNITLSSLKLIGESVIKPYEKSFLSEDVDGRAKTEYELSSLGKPVLLPLLEYSRHFSPQARRLAARILSKIDDEIATRRLMDMTRDSEAEVRTTAILSIGHIKTQTALKYLISCLQSPDPLVVDAASVALTTRGKEIINLLTELLADRDLNLQVTIARLIGRIAESDFVPMLAKHLNDPRMWVRRAVCFALGETKNPIAADYLIGKGLRDSDTLVRTAAVGALGKIKLNITADALINALNDPEESVQLAAMQSIAEAGVTAAGQYLLRFLSYDSTMLKITAIRTIAQINYVLAIPVLRKMAKSWPFGHESNEVKSEAKTALKKLLFEAQFTNQ